MYFHTKYHSPSLHTLFFFVVVILSFFLYFLERLDRNTSWFSQLIFAIVKTERETKRGYYAGALQMNIKGLEQEPELHNIPTQLGLLRLFVLVEA